MAPNAQIVVAEFSGDPLRDGAETQAAQYLATHYGGGEVSNSWGYNNGEGWCGVGNCELAWDSYFTQSGVVYFASAGDYGVGPQYPSVSPNVVSVGGTSIQRDANGNFTGESCWGGSGGGISVYEPLPQYELFVANKTGSKRGTPDWAAVADPGSGVDVYNSTYCNGWCRVGGTSAAAPIVAGIVNQAGGFSASTARELSKTYQLYVNPVGYHTKFYDVTSGTNGSPAGPGWDQCTGLGSIRQPTSF
jgi:subtilase family serine protease